MASKSKAKSSKAQVFTSSEEDGNDDDDDIAPVKTEKNTKSKAGASAEIRGKKNQEPVGSDKPKRYGGFFSLTHHADTRSNYPFLLLSQ